MRIAIVGGGIAGMTAAHLLHPGHEITLFEANDYVGGHTHTHEVEAEGRRYAVDSGFIVFNETTYPGFTRLMHRLGVPYQPSTMTFSLRNDGTGLEYSPHSLSTLFVQRRNLVSPSFWRMLLGVLRFRREYQDLLDRSDGGAELGPLLRSRRYPPSFERDFLIPLGAALWSASPEEIERFPLRALVAFFRNHGFLEPRHPLQWQVIRGGSQRYVERLTAPYADRIRRRTPVGAIARHPDWVEVVPAGGPAERFDHVLLACHSDQALALLQDPTQAERQILAAIPYRANTAVLHTDTRLLPRHRSIWSSWNYLVPGDDAGRSAITYDMNILQGLSAPVEFCVTLNHEEGIAAERVVGRYQYHHPVFQRDAPAAQARHGEISGVHRTHYAGAYWGYGFHEDGLQSAIAACRPFGVETDG